jgi:hypothetical protein
MSGDSLLKLSADEIKEFMADNLPPEAVKTLEKPPEEAKRRICLGVLTYDARIYTRTMMCMMEAVMQCAAQGWGFTYILRENDSMVARGRSYLASQFLENPTAANCTDLVFVDTDLEWRGQEFVKLCTYPVDIVGGAYPFKDESGTFPLRWPSDGLFEEEFTCGRLWSVQAVTPGFFRVTRKALLKIVGEHPWLEFKDRGNPDGQRSWMFFDNLQRATGVYDEGYVFCERARQAGYKVYLDPDMHFKHIGIKAYDHGTISEWLDKKSEQVTHLQSEFPNVPPLKLVSKIMGEAIDLQAEAARESAA